MWVSPFATVHLPHLGWSRLGCLARRLPRCALQRWRTLRKRVVGLLLLCAFRYCTTQMLRGMELHLGGRTGPQGAQPDRVPACTSAMPHSCSTQLKRALALH